MGVEVAGQPGQQLPEHLLAAVTERCMLGRGGGDPVTPHAEKQKLRWLRVVLSGGGPLGAGPAPACQSPALPPPLERAGETRRPGRSRQVPEKGLE